METESSFPMAGAVRSRTLRWLAAASAMFMALSVLARLRPRPTKRADGAGHADDGHRRLPFPPFRSTAWSGTRSWSATPSTPPAASPRPDPRVLRRETNETARSNILAYNITTGNLITTWAPSLNAQGRAITARQTAPPSTSLVTSPRSAAPPAIRAAALNATTGAVISGFNANVNAHVNDPRCPDPPCTWSERSPSSATRPGPGWPRSARPAAP